MMGEGVCWKGRSKECAYLFGMRCRGQPRIDVYYFLERTLVAIAERLEHVPARDVGDDAVWGLWRRCVAKFGLRTENSHSEGVVLYSFS